MRTINKRSLIIVILRISIGFIFLYSGIDKLLNDFSSEGYLAYATSGPFKDFFSEMAGNSIIDFLVVYGQIGIGLSLLLGVLTRFGSICGVIMMVLFYISALPAEHGPIDDHIIYALVFIQLGIFGAGRYLGVDKYIGNSDFVKNHFKYFRFILG
ncbi:MAG: DoxX family protein [Candidatus Dojkabacteria bacterium]|nr:DoxX family protein [Candidatus Dojkabacteria bacterium]MDQ7021203.1 DoxX family protein [Candidatus Dojkabacteria bacterium]